MRSETRSAEPGRGGAGGSLLRRLGWFVLLWLAGVGTVGAVAFVIRLWIS